MKPWQFTCPAHSVASVAARAVRGSSPGLLSIGVDFFASLCSPVLGNSWGREPLRIDETLSSPRLCGQAAGVEYRTST